ncbi:MAG: PAS domain-containing sensor histidine kinase [Ignavibacteria bacterium]|jgi:PAS domain S-box-containing protein|nr:PAS domain-containing sensor histidine kinase [Ignavibacteria bacterium]MCU7501965.1 PAS domain-containing sensor histidine kinase [Ignavibacteria bacterium]MCU7516933.1 PAS domain-containing sensor histidine kinase [Ignavibacteria bacterium]
MTDTSPDSMDHTENIPKRFESLDDFKLLEEFPDTKSLVIVNIAGEIVYSNHSFEKTFQLKEHNNIFDIESEPRIFHLVQGLAGSHYSSCHLEIFFQGGKSEVPMNFLAEIERIFLQDQELFAIVLSSLEDKYRLENKINSLHNALEFGNVPVIITDGMGRVTFSTRSFEEILGTNIELLYNKPIQNALEQFLDAPALEEVKNKIAMRQKCTRIISGLHSDGTLWYNEITITPVQKDEPAPVSFIVTANDITNYILKNRIAKRSEERQKLIINNISDLLLIVRNEKESLFFENANDNFYETFSIKRERALEKKIEEVFDEHFLMVLTQAVTTLLRIKSGFHEFRYKNYVLEREYLGSITFTEDLYESQRIFIISLKDITEQLLNEERLRKAYQKETHINKLKSSFLANMSHEIRTPLNAIVGYSELIEDDVNAGNIASAAELFPYLKEGYARLLKLVDNILEVSLIQSGETEFEIGRTRISEILRAVYQSMMNAAVEKTLAFDLDIEDENLSINADSKKLEKIIAALVDNAIKYTEARGRVRLSSRMEGSYAKVVISDTGIGIKKESLARLFEAFTQEDEGHKRQFEGAGLGLTIAYNLTKMMGGELSVDSIINEGTTITLTFPIPC